MSRGSEGAGLGMRWACSVAYLPPNNLGACSQCSTHMDLFIRISEQVVQESPVDKFPSDSKPLIEKNKQEQVRARGRGWSP